MTESDFLKISEALDAPAWQLLYAIVSVWADKSGCGDWVEDICCELTYPQVELPLIEPLLAHLRVGQSYRVVHLTFECRGEQVRWTHSDNLDLPPQYVPATEIIAELAELQTALHEAQAQGVTLEKGLMAFLGYSESAQAVVFHLLARSQTLLSSQVTGCWGLIPRLGASTCQELLANLKGNWGWGWFEMMFEVVGEQVKASLWPIAYEGECPRQEFIKELETLLHRFYNAI